MKGEVTSASIVAARVAALPPTSFFLTSAVFHYLGPSLAVLLFAHVDVLGVAWLRIASAALVFAVWRRPWRLLGRLAVRQRWVLAALGAVLAAMNTMFYLALDQLPLSTVGAVEFMATLVLAALGARTARNLFAVALAVAGVYALTDIRLMSEPWGFAFAFANCAGFLLYVILGHRVATTRVGSTTDAKAIDGIDQLGAAMLIAAVVAAPFGFAEATAAFSHPLWLFWGIGVGICSSVIPYVADQLAMSRLPRATFALMLALLPATATVIGFVVLGQSPSGQELLGIGLVISGIGLHRQRQAAESRNPNTEAT